MSHINYLSRKILNDCSLSHPRGTPQQPYGEVLLQRSKQKPRKDGTLLKSHSWQKWDEN